MLPRNYTIYEAEASRLHCDTLYRESSNGRVTLDPGSPPLLAWIYAWWRAAVIDGGDNASVPGNKPSETMNSRRSDASGPSGPRRRAGGEPP